MSANKKKCNLEGINLLLISIIIQCVLAVPQAKGQAPAHNQAACAASVAGQAPRQPCDACGDGLSRAEELVNSLESMGSGSTTMSNAGAQADADRASLDRRLAAAEMLGHYPTGQERAMHDAVANLPPILKEPPPRGCGPDVPVDPVSFQHEQREELRNEAFAKTIGVLGGIAGGAAAGRLMHGAGHLANNAIQSMRGAGIQATEIAVQEVEAHGGRAIAQAALRTGHHAAEQVAGHTAEHASEQAAERAVTQSAAAGAGAEAAESPDGHGGENRGFLVRHGNAIAMATMEFIATRIPGFNIAGGGFLILAGGAVRAITAGDALRAVTHTFGVWESCISAAAQAARRSNGGAGGDGGNAVTNANFHEPTTAGNSCGGPARAPAGIDMNRARTDANYRAGLIRNLRTRITCDRARQAGGLSREEATSLEPQVRGGAARLQSSATTQCSPTTNIGQALAAHTPSAANPTNICMGQCTDTHAWLHGL